MMNRRLLQLLASICIMLLILHINPGLTAREQLELPPDPAAFFFDTPIPAVPAASPPPAPAVDSDQSVPTFARPANAELAPDYVGPNNRSLDIIPVRPATPPAPASEQDERLAMASANVSAELSTDEQTEYRGLVRKFLGMSAADKRLAVAYIARVSPFELMQIVAWFIRNTPETKSLLYEKLEQHFTEQEIETMEDLVYKYR